MLDSIRGYVRNAFKSSRAHTRYWAERKIDWKVQYFDTWDHPHRYLISQVLKTFHWNSLLEVGCGAGANLANIVVNHPNKQLGGTDISTDAIATAEKVFQGAFFKVCPMDDIMMSDDSVDVILTDMALIYADRKTMNKTLREFMRIARTRIVLCEFHSDSLWERIKTKVMTGYNVYNYVQLLEKHGFYDVTRYKIPARAWPGGLQEKIGYIIVAKVPRRK